MIYHKKEGVSKETRQIAVVSFIQSDSVLFALVNDKYDSKEKDCFILYRDTNCK